jgi:Eukaryotic aspartyl protease
VFGIQYKTNIGEGILGVGFVDPNTVDTSLTAALTTQGYIASKAFSLYQNDDMGAGGFLLFGGVDTTKYCGNLVTNDMVPTFATDTEVTFITLPILNIGGTDANGNPVVFTDGSSPGKGILDSGTSFTYLPPDLVQSIWDFVGAAPQNPSDSLANFPCVPPTSTASINFAFNGITIEVPLTQLSSSTNVPGTCTFGIGKQTPGDVGLLGDTVLSSFYIVYDLDNKQISLAPAIYTTIGAPSNILAIGTGSNAVPHVAGPDCPKNPPTTGTATSTNVQSTTTTTTTTMTTSSLTSTSQITTSTSSLTSIRLTTTTTTLTGAAITTSSLTGTTTTTGISTGTTTTAGTSTGSSLTTETSTGTTTTTGISTGTTTTAGTSTGSSLTTETSVGTTTTIGNSTGTGFTTTTSTGTGLATSTSTGGAGGSGGNGGKGGSSGEGSGAGGAGGNGSGALHSNGAVRKHENRHSLTQYLVAASLLIFAI